MLYRISNYEKKKLQFWWRLCYQCCYPWWVSCFLLFDYPSFFFFFPGIILSISWFSLLLFIADYGPLLVLKAFSQFGGPGPWNFIFLASIYWSILDVSYVKVFKALKFFDFCSFLHLLFGAIICMVMLLCATIFSWNYFKFRSIILIPPRFVVDTCISALSKENRKWQKGNYVVKVTWLRFTKVKKT